MELIDSHCHLFYDQLKEDIHGVFDRANELDVHRFITVGTNLEDSNECRLLAAHHDAVYGTAGIHPHDAKDAPIKYIDQLKALLSGEKMVAAGEMGLDYFRNISASTLQKKVFREQLALAGEMNKPVIFHNRDADEDTIRILSDFKGIRGVAHCFSSNLETATAFLEMGLYISFSGNLTFKNSHLPEVAAVIPLDKILVETDSPYLSPMPFRGKTNEPGRTRFVAEILAEIHGLPLDIIAEKTTANTEALFGI